MDKEVAQLMEMGASAAQARAALTKYKDVMQAAERFFEGEFSDIMDEDSRDSLVNLPSSGRAGIVDTIHQSKTRMFTPQDDNNSDSEVPEEDNADEEEDDDDEDGFVDYDSDYDMKAESGRAPATSVDPYAGIFFSKDRREEVIEVEEDAELVKISGCPELCPLMTQGSWMKGCPEGGEQGFLFSLYSELSEGSCPCPTGCGHSVIRKKSDFFAIYPEFPAYVDHLRGMVRRKCKLCPSTFCFACGEPVTAERNQAGVMALDENPLYHCSNLQGVILGMGLTMLETLYNLQAREAGISKPVDGSASQNSKKRKAEPNSSMPAMPQNFDDDDDDVYYGAKGKKAKAGIGYAGAVREDNSGQLEAASLQKAKDTRMALLLQSIRDFLPNLHRAEGCKTSDYLVHPTTLAHLRRRFNLVSSRLLRNDSLADMSDRSVLYFELFVWLETISNHEALASMMAMPIMVASSTKAVNTIKTGGRKIRERTIIYEGSSGPRELLEAIVIQAQAACKGLEGPKPQNAVAHEMTEEEKRTRSSQFDDNDKGKGKAMSQEAQAVPDENRRLLDFCHRILGTAAAIDRSLKETKGDDFLGRLKASLPKVPSSMNEVISSSAQGFELGPAIVGRTEEETKKIYMDWAMRVRFEYCDLTIPPPDGKRQRDDPDYSPNFKFAYNNEARMLLNSEVPRRALAIAKELAVLTTNLPVAWDSSIFLRVDESRVDVIKALITGPEGTPYYNGCYLFDIFLGPTYNQTAPSVKYMTTNGGKFRFNPNLYADGKVCLSLLGTWQGPGWIPGRSTLLQVLISIQSMILCEEPYLNEPGWAGDGGSPASKAYSANVRRMAVHSAMLGNLKNPPEPFADVIQTHFRLKAKSISAQLDDWLAKDDGSLTQPDGGGYNRKKAGAAGGSANGFKKDVDELKALLLKLQNEEGSSSSSAI